MDGRRSGLEVFADRRGFTHLAAAVIAGAAALLFSGMFHRIGEQLNGLTVFQ